MSAFHLIQGLIMLFLATSIIQKIAEFQPTIIEGINRFRWFEYAFSSSVMIVLIATLFGIYDIEKRKNTITEDVGS